MYSTHLEVSLKIYVCLCVLMIFIYLLHYRKIDAFIFQSNWKIQQMKHKNVLNNFLTLVKHFFLNRTLANM